MVAQVSDIQKTVSFTLKRVNVMVCYIAIEKELKAVIAMITLPPGHH